MKYTTTTTLIALFGMTHALPHPQKPADAALPSFSFPTPTSGYGNGGSGGGRPPARPSATQGAKPSFPSASGPGEGNGNAPSGGKPPGLSGGAGQGFDLGGLLDQLKHLPELSALPQASSTPGAGGARPKFDLGTLLGGLIGGNGPKPSGTPGAGGAGLDLGSLLGGLTGSKPSGTPGTGGAGLDLGSVLGGLTGGSFSNPSGAPGSVGAGLDLGGLLGGLTGGLTGEKGGEKGTSPGSGFNLGNLFGGNTGLGDGIGTSPTSTPAPVASKTEAASAPTGTDSTGGGNTGNCKPQSPGSSSENGITDKNCCADMTVVFARGTGELGNVGTVTGPPMFKALRSKLGNDRVVVQGVDYPASSAGNANLGGDGGKKMAEVVAQVLSQCPSTKVIVSGYSQGAMVVHNAFSNGLSASKVAGAVLFGDPLKRQAVGDLSTDKVKQFCGTSDQICGGGGDGGATGGHISYSSSADAAATFAIQAAGLS